MEDFLKILFSARRDFLFLLETMHIGLFYSKLHHMMVVTMVLLMRVSCALDPRVIFISEISEGISERNIALGLRVGFIII